MRCFVTTSLLVLSVACGHGKDRNSGGGDDDDTDKTTPVAQEPDKTVTEDEDRLAPFSDATRAAYALVPGAANPKVVLYLARRAGLDFDNGLPSLGVSELANGTLNIGGRFELQGAMADFTRLHEEAKAAGLNLVLAEIVLKSATVTSPDGDKVKANFGAPNATPTSRALLGFQATLPPQLHDRAVAHLNAGEPWDDVFRAELATEMTGSAARVPLTVALTIDCVRNPTPGTYGPFARVETDACSRYK